MKWPVSSGDYPACKSALCLLLIAFLFVPSVYSQNLAPLATASHSSGNWPYKYNDGVYTSSSNHGWVSASNSSGYGAWIQFDWGATPQTFNTITFYQSHHTCNTQRRTLVGGTIQIWNGSSWVNHYNFSAPPQMVLAVTFPTVTTRRVRITNYSIHATMTTCVGTCTFGGGCTYDRNPTFWEIEIGSSVVLPAGFSGFTASAAGETVDLHWNTADVGNERFFVVERAIGEESGAGSAEKITHLTVDENGDAVGGNVDATQGHTSHKTELVFAEIGRVFSLGSEFHFLDPTPATHGVNYYRIRAVDPDGQEFYSTVEQVRFAPSPNSPLHLYPNPVQHLASLDLGENSDAETVRIQIFDLPGRRVRSETLDMHQGASVAPLDLGGLQAGVYLLVISDGIRTWKQKFMKE